MENNTNFLQPFFAVLLPPGLPPGSKGIKTNILSKPCVVYHLLWVAAFTDWEAVWKASEKASWNEGTV